MKNYIEKIWQAVFNLIFPVKCLGGCGRYDTWLCPQCSKRLETTLQPECPICRIPQFNNHVCSACRTQTPLSGLIVLTDYQIPLIQKIVHTLKYQFVTDLGEIMGKMLARKIKSEFTGQIQHIKPIIMPVPLHWRRKNERGFNQAKCLAVSIASVLDWPIKADILIRKAYTRPQARLSRAERLINLKSAFELKRGVVLSGQKVIIIDDVATTTATLNECAKVLKLAGAKEVWGAVLARSQK
ncbi:MAG: ComF family protein [Patescibacteria group bacterium]|nr:ComF family protein [Patescibacteria group bacterium]